MKKYYARAYWLKGKLRRDVFSNELQPRVVLYDNEKGELKINGKNVDDNDLLIKDIEKNIVEVIPKAKAFLVKEDEQNYKPFNFFEVCN